MLKRLFTNPTLLKFAHERSFESEDDVKISLRLLINYSYLICLKDLFSLS